MFHIYRSKTRDLTRSNESHQHAIHTLLLLITGRYTLLFSLCVLLASKPVFAKFLHYLFIIISFVHIKALSLSRRIINPGANSTTFHSLSDPRATSIFASHAAIYPGARGTFPPLSLSLAYGALLLKARSPNNLRHENGAMLGQTTHRWVFSTPTRGREREREQRVDVTRG